MPVLPQVSGCQHSGLFRAFSQHLLHRLHIRQEGPQVRVRQEQARLVAEVGVSVVAVNPHSVAVHICGARCECDDRGGEWSTPSVSRRPLCSGGFLVPSPSTS